MTKLPAGEEPGFYVHYIYKTPFGLPLDDQRGNFSLTYAYSACIAFIELDPETGKVHLRRIGLVEDSGNKINPLIVEGQTHGQMAHQVGAALFERLVYDEEGQLLTASFMDYLAATAMDLPKFETDSITVPSLFTPLGTRGMGEGGGAPLIACINAMEDALSPFGIQLRDSHLNPEEMWKLVRSRLKDGSKSQ